MHSKPIQTAVSDLKPGPDAFRMSDGDDNPLKELKIFPEDIWGPPSQQDSEEKDKNSKLIMSQTIDEALADFHAKLEFLRGRVSNAQYTALEKKLENFRKELGALTSGNTGATGNSRPEISLFKAATTYAHNGRTINVGILRAGDDEVNFLDAHKFKIFVQKCFPWHSTNARSAGTSMMRTWASQTQWLTRARSSTRSHRTGNAQSAAHPSLRLSS